MLHKCITKRRIRADVQLAIRLHRALWIWLSKHPTKEKEDWPGWIFNGGNVTIIKVNCFMCEAAEGHCCVERCLLSWGNPRVKCISGCCVLRTTKNEYDELGIFARWCETSDPKKRSQLAYAIAHLPVRGQYKIK